MSATKQFLYPRAFIPHNLIPRDLYRRLMVEVENVVDDPNNVEDDAIFMHGGRETVRLIAEDDDKFRWGMDGAFHLNNNNIEDIFEARKYIFVDFEHQGITYCGWVDYDSNEVVALHKHDCNLLMEEVVMEEKYENFAGEEHSEVWTERGKLRTYSLSIYATAESAAVDGSIMDTLSEVDTLAMSAQEIADRINADLAELDKNIMATSEIEANYELLPWCNFSGYKVEVDFRHESEKVTAQEVVERVKKPLYEELGIDPDLAASVEGW